jgi:hypothetical protein
VREHPEEGPDYPAFTSQLESHFTHTLFYLAQVLLHLRARGLMAGGPTVWFGRCMAASPTPRSRHGTANRHSSDRWGWRGGLELVREAGR